MNAVMQMTKQMNPRFFMKATALAVVSMLLVLHLGTWFFFGAKGAAYVSLFFYILVGLILVAAPLIKEEADLDGMLK